MSLAYRLSKPTNQLYDSGAPNPNSLSSHTHNRNQSLMGRKSSHSLAGGKSSFSSGGSTGTRLTSLFDGPFFPADKLSLKHSQGSMFDNKSFDLPNLFDLLAVGAVPTEPPKFKGNGFSLPFLKNPVFAEPFVPAEQYDKSATVELKMKELELHRLITDYDKLQKLVKTTSFLVPLLKDELGRPSAEIEVPERLKHVFQRLITSLMSKERELTEAKNRLEALYTAVLLNPSKTMTKYGQYDEEEMAHRLVTRLEKLVEENQELRDMLDLGKSREKDIQIGLLLTENKRLKEQVDRYEQSLKNKSK